MDCTWETKILFGKHKDKTFQWVALFDPQYFQWLLTKCDHWQVQTWKYGMRQALLPTVHDQLKEMMKRDSMWDKDND